MKAFLVFRGQYDDRRTEKVFSSKLKANNYIKKCQRFGTKDPYSYKELHDKIDPIFEEWEVV